MSFDHKSGQIAHHILHISSTFESKAVENAIAYYIRI